MVRKKKTAKTTSAGSREKTRRPTEKKAATKTISKQEPDTLPNLDPVPKTLEKVSPTTPEIRIDTCESIDADSLSQDFAAAAAAEDTRPKELFRRDTLDEVVEVEHDASLSPTLPEPEREALNVLEDAIAESEMTTSAVDETIRQDSLESNDSLEPLKIPTSRNDDASKRAMESSVSYEVLDPPYYPVTPAPMTVYPSLAAELMESDADGAIQMGIEESAYRDYLLSRSQPSEEGAVGGGGEILNQALDNRDSIEADFLSKAKSSEGTNRPQEAVTAPPEEDNVFEKAFADACDMQLQAALTASLDEAALRKALNGEAAAEVDLTNVTALTESLTEATTVSTLSPSAPPMMDVAEMPLIAEAEALTPGILVLPEGSVEKINRRMLEGMDSLEQPSEASETMTSIADSATVETLEVIVLEASAPDLINIEASASAVEGLEASAPVETEASTLNSEAGAAVNVEEIHVVSKAPLSQAELLELCANPLLIQQTKILEDFFAEVSPALTSQHPLHELLVEYQRSRTKLLALEEHLFQLKRDMEAQLPGLWSSSMQSTTVEGICRDNHKVSQQLTYEKVAFNSDHLPNVARALSTVRIFAQEQLSHAAFVCAKNRLKVNVYLHKLYTEECSMLQNIPAGASVTSNDAADLDVVLRHQIKILRSCINVLFAFQRRPISDSVFQVSRKGEKMCLICNLNMDMAMDMAIAEDEVIEFS